MLSSPLLSSFSSSSSPPPRSPTSSSVKAQTINEQDVNKVLNDPSQFRILQQELRDKKYLTSSFLRATIDVLLRARLDEMDKKNCQLKIQSCQKNVFQALQTHVESFDSDIEEVVSDDNEEEEEFESDQDEGKLDNKNLDQICLRQIKQNQILVKQPQSHLKTEDSDQLHQSPVQKLQSKILEGEEDSDIEEVFSDDEEEGDKYNQEERKVDDMSTFDSLLSHGPGGRGRTVLSPRSLQCKDQSLDLQDISQLVCDARIMRIDITKDQDVELEESKQAV